MLGKCTQQPPRATSHRREKKKREKTRGFGGRAGTFAGCFLGLGVVLFVTPGMRSDERGPGDPNSRTKVLGRVFLCMCGEISQLGEFFFFSENEKRHENFVICMDSFRHFSKFKK